MAASREIPDTHRWVLDYLRRAGRPLTARYVGGAVTDRHSSYGYGLGYDRAYGALTALARRGLVLRHPGRPARFEVPDA